MYYRLTTDTVRQNVFLRRKSHRFTTMIKGTPLPDTTPVPFEFSMEVDRDVTGRDEAPRMFAFMSEPCVMQNSFLETLRTAGVDNIQAFPAVLTDVRTGQQYTDFVAANVVGMVSCANVAESRTSPLADVYYFHDLVLDPAKTGDLLLFRLAESQLEIIVHEKVAAAIQAAGFEGVVLEPLRETSTKP